MNLNDSDLQAKLAQSGICEGRTQNVPGSMRTAGNFNFCWNCFVSLGVDIARDFQLICEELNRGVRHCCCSLTQLSPWHWIELDQGLHVEQMGKREKEEDVTL